MAILCPPKLVILPGSRRWKTEVVDLEPTEEQLGRGGKRSPFLRCLIQTVYMIEHLNGMNPNETIQPLEFMRVLLANSPGKVVELWKEDSTILMVQFPRQGFADTRFWKCPPIYGGTKMDPESEVIRPVAGIFFSLAFGSKFEQCLPLFKSLNSDQAMAACSVHRDDPVLLIWDMVRYQDCPPLLNSLENYGAYAA